MHRVNKQVVWGKSRHCPPGYGHTALLLLWPFKNQKKLIFYVFLPSQHLIFIQYFLWTSQSTYRNHSNLTPPCSKHAGSKVRGQVYPNYVSLSRSCCIQLSWWSENANKGFKSNQFVSIVLTCLHNKNWISSRAHTPLFHSIILVFQ